MLFRSKFEEESEKRKSSGINNTLEDKIDTNKMKKCIRTKNGAAVFNPYLFTTELFKYLNKNYAVSIYENTRIDDIKNEKNMNINTTNNDNKIYSNHTILATGNDALVKIKDKNTRLNVTYTIVTNKIRGLERLDLDYVAIDNKSPHHYLRFTRDKRIIFGGEDVALRSYKIDSEKMMEFANKKYTKLYKELIKTFYMLDNVEIEYAYSSILASTKHSMPIIDKLKGLENVYCYLGYAGNGIVFSTIGAKHLVKIIDKKENNLELEMYEINRTVKK